MIYLQHELRPAINATRGAAADPYLPHLRGSSLKTGRDSSRAWTSPIAVLRRRSSQGRSRSLSSPARVQASRAAAPRCAYARRAPRREMVATGMTNKEIAQALFVTLRAVEMHLTNAYGKLGITSRRDLARALAA